LLLNHCCISQEKIIETTCYESTARCIERVIPIGSVVN
jgi:hypothetical protein